MPSSAPVELINKQNWLDPLADQLQPRIARALGREGPIGPKAATFLHGSWLGHPLHVVLTDVPIGSWTAAAVLDVIEANTGSRAIGRGADAAIKIGLFGATAAAITGLADWSKIGGGSRRRIGLMHGLLNATAAVCYATSLGLRSSRSREAGRKFALLGFIVANASAYLGGHLVYKERVGMDHSAGYSPPEEFVAVMPETELAENELRRVDAEGMPVLLVRRGERIYAIGETCSHLGGPLSQGKLEDLSVRCPWHGSCYSLEDGRVIEGPSAHAQPLLEVRIRDGQIEVRRARRSGYDLAQSAAKTEERQGGEL
ncbi:MAG TPA: Rieske 2Fe-2S domain-containing protein [Candidatus Binatia bacterium]|nr:Rieske 2Fe-2S domain-containing protein [Candidatus Binatia bacterium]